MIDVFCAILFGISSNLDNIVIGIAYGIKKIKIGALPNFIIAAITVSGTVISMYMGKIMASYMPASLANAAGAGMIILLGLYFLTQSTVSFYKKNKSTKIIALKDSEEMLEYARKSDKDVSGNIDAKESVAVGFGLALNNVGTGIAASAGGIGILSTAVFTFIFSIAFISLGTELGNKIVGNFFGKFAPFISGIILIILGVVKWIF